MTSFKTIGCVIGILLPGPLAVCASDESPTARISKVFHSDFMGKGAAVNVHFTGAATKTVYVDVAA